MDPNVIEIIKQVKSDQINLTEFVNTILKTEANPKEKLSLLGTTCFELGEYQIAVVFLLYSLHLKPDAKDLYLFTQTNHMMNPSLVNRYINAPLVSILIPTYNRVNYLELALQSALLQTYTNIEIIICDNSENDESMKMVETYTEWFPQIKYFKNPTNIGASGNFKRCYDMSSGEFINYLLDDDLLHSEKIEKMVSCFQQFQDIKLVTSHRQFIDEHGNEISTPNKLYNEDTLVDAIKFLELSLIDCDNLIGEPTTVLFRKQDLIQFGVFLDKQFNFLQDFISWLQILKDGGKVIYLASSLSYFRRHEEQGSQNIQLRMIGFQEWLQVIDYIVEHKIAPNLNDDTLYARLLTHFEWFIRTHTKQGNLEEIRKFGAKNVLNGIAERLL